MFRQTAGNLLPADDWVQQPQGFFFNNLPVESWLRGAPYRDAGRCFTANGTLMDATDAQWVGTYEEAVEKCAQLADCNMIHDWGCDGRNFRVCESALCCNCIFV